MVLHMDLSAVTANKVPLFRVSEIGPIDSLCGEGTVEWGLVGVTEETVMRNHVFAEITPKILS